MPYSKGISSCLAETLRFAIVGSFDHRSLRILDRAPDKSEKPGVIPSLRGFNVRYPDEFIIMLLQNGPVGTRSDKEYPTP